MSGAIASDMFALVRAIHLIATASLMGALLFRLVAAPALAPPDAGGSTRLARHLRGLVLASLAVAFLSALVWPLFVAADAADTSIGGAISSGSAWTLLTATSFGRVWLFRLGLMILLGAAVWFQTRFLAHRHAAWHDLLPPPSELGFHPSSDASRVTEVGNIRLRLRGRGGEGGGHALLTLVLATALMASLAFAGHAAAGEGPAGALHVTADVVHLVAAAAWLGGLVPLALVLRNADSLDAAHVVTARFSLLAVNCVCALILTGILNTVMLAGSVPALIGTGYGQLLAVKLALFAVMLGFAAMNRFRLTPALAGWSEPARRDAARRLVRNTLAESGLGILVLVIVGWLGILQPGVHQESWWPLAFRPADSLDLSFPPEPGLLALVMITVGLGVLAAGIGSRRRSLVASGLLIALVSVPGLSGLTVVAYPTSFRSSPTGYTAASIARGRDLFALSCAGCHGAGGKGDGPAARDLPVRPADLTADHVYDHRDGDLFWWITHGLGAMPGFAGPDEAAPWNLIDFIHANADGVRLRAQPGAVTAAAFPAPAAILACSDGGHVLADLVGRPVRLVGAASAARSAPPGIVTVIVGEGEPEGTACIVRDRELAAVLAIYGGADDAVTSEVLIDAEGRVRALWLPGTAADWSDPATLARLVADLARLPALPGRAPSQTHHH